MQHLKMQAMSTKTPFHFVFQPNWVFNADASAGHGFAILWVSFGSLLASRSGGG